MKPGDVVQLRSGGQIMTVQRVEADQVVCVYWNAESKKFDSSIFLQVVLKVLDGY